MNHVSLETLIILAKSGDCQAHAAIRAYNRLAVSKETRNHAVSVHTFGSGFYPILTLRKNAE